MKNEIRVICMGCGTEGMHEMGGPVRLRDKHCRNCGGRGRPAWWVKKYAHRASSEATGTAIMRNRYLRWCLEQPSAR